MEGQARSNMPLQLFLSWEHKKKINQWLASCFSYLICNVKQVNLSMSKLLTTNTPPFSKCRPSDLWWARVIVP